MSNVQILANSLNPHVRGNAWRKWRQSGAVGNMETNRRKLADTASNLSPNKMPWVPTGIHVSDDKGEVRDLKANDYDKDFPPTHVIGSGTKSDPFVCPMPSAWSPHSTAIDLWRHANKTRNLKIDLAFIKVKSRIVGYNDEFVLRFGNTYNNLKKEVKEMGFRDIIIYATAIYNDAKVLTGDKHFKNLNRTIFLNKN